MIYYYICYCTFRIHGNSKIKPYPCEKCGQSFDTQGGLNIHFSCLHKNEKDKILAKRSKLSSYNPIMNEKNEIGQVECNKSQDNNHGQDNVCHLCGQQFEDCVSVIHHKLVHHLIPNP